MLKVCTVVCMATLVVASVESSVFAQGAGAKMQGNYNFWQAQGWQQQAQHQSRALYYYGQTENPTAEQAKEHAKAARSAVASSQKHLAELKKANPDNKEAQAAITKVESINKKVLGHCDMCDQAIAKGDYKECGACCAEIVHDLHDADAAMKTLQKALDIHHEVPKKK
ncbi:MAG: hypothetical protein U0941_07860 [Planctomycetaceae bacterium]